MYFTYPFSSSELLLQLTSELLEGTIFDVEGLGQQIIGIEQLI